MTLHREGFVPVGGVVVTTSLILGLLEYFGAPDLIFWIGASCCAIVFVLFAQFFRIPKRSPKGSGPQVIAPSISRMRECKSVFL